jgi:hypothetical protein
MKVCDNKRIYEKRAYVFKYQEIKRRGEESDKVYFGKNLF